VRSPVSTAGDSRLPQPVKFPAQLLALPVGFALPLTDSEADDAVRVDSTGPARAWWGTTQSQDQAYRAKLAAAARLSGVDRYLAYAKLDRELTASAARGSPSATPRRTSSSPPGWAAW